MITSFAHFSFGLLVVFVIIFMFYKSNSFFVLFVPNILILKLVLFVICSQIYWFCSYVFIYFYFLNLILFFYILLE